MKFAHCSNHACTYLMYLTETHNELNRRPDYTRCWYFLMKQNIKNCNVLIIYCKTINVIKIFTYQWTSWVREVMYCFNAYFITLICRHDTYAKYSVARAIVCAIIHIYLFKNSCHPTSPLPYVWTGIRVICR